MKRNESRAQVAIAVRACQEKKAADISILRLDEQASGFTDYFVVCSGANPRQVQAIADEVDEKLSATGVEPSHREGTTRPIGSCWTTWTSWCTSSPRARASSTTWSGCGRRLRGCNSPIWRSLPANPQPRRPQPAPSAAKTAKSAAKSAAKKASRKRVPTARSRKSS